MKELINLKTRRNLLLFIIPSALGVFLFMLPIAIDNKVTIPIAFFAESLIGLLKPIINSLTLTIICLSASLAFLCKIINPKFCRESDFFKLLLTPSWIWVLLRILGASFAVLTFSELGPVAIVSKNTGSLVFYELIPTLFAVFTFAGLFLPLVLDFGLLEFFGTILTKFMRPLFNLPGRSGIDCLASWVGDGSVGIILTSKQYEGGHYTEREAAVIGTCFSVVSVTFGLVVLSQVKLEHMFLAFYLTVCVTGIITAMILSRIPPLSWKKDHFIDEKPAEENREIIPKGYNYFTYGLRLALEKVNSIKELKPIALEGIKNVVEMLFGLLPVVMAVGTCALMLAEYTSIFTILGKPYVPLLELMSVPEAQKASETLMVGFADMFVPSILATSIESDFTRFIIAVVSVSQLIYMSEVGALLIGSRIPVSLVEMFIIFVLRTLVALPVSIIMAGLFF